DFAIEWYPRLSLRRDRLIFPSVTELQLRYVKLASAAGLWDVFRAFGPTLEELKVECSFRFP
ncbi:hypothetical protein WG66_003571, partial [Moniliophthora roreri]